MVVKIMCILPFSVSVLSAHTPTSTVMIKPACVRCGVMIKPACVRCGVCVLRACSFHN